MQVSFHKYGDNFFPGTGAQGDVGHSSGKGYSINVPLREGMDDESYKFMYEPVMKKVMAVRSLHCLLRMPSLLYICGLCCPVNSLRARLAWFAADFPLQLALR